MHFDYLLYETLWALPVIVFEWLYGGRILLRHWRFILIPSVGVAAFLTAADSVAISQGVWRFDHAQLLNIYIGPVPIEEAIFFLLTNLMATQGLLLFLWSKGLIEER
jgi:putative membrane protein